MTICFQPTKRLFHIAVIALITASFSATAYAEDTKAQSPPAVGEQARDFALKSLDSKTVKLSALTKEGPVVLLVLRGYPGYQCPICTRQVGDFVRNASGFAEKKARVVMVYPGPADNLTQYAKEFARGKTLPENFYLLTDPDYKFTNAYALRWDAPRETAYPSTFVIGDDNKISFAKISKKHGGRTSATEVLKEVK